MIAITHVRGMLAHCRECGELREVYETPICKDGPYCAGCIDNIAEEEDQGAGRLADETQ